MVTFASITNTGGRAVNEDSVRACEKDGRHLFALADGLGGHGGGEVASQYAVETCDQVFQAGGGLEDCFWAAQNGLLEEQARMGASDEMKTTLALLRLDGDMARWGHVGDSRVYRFSGSQLAARTLDHSVPQMLVMSGELREKQIRRHEDRNRLLRVLGIEWNSPKFELSGETPLTPGDSYLLCSDGFWDWIVEKQMLRLLKQSQSPEQWLTRMEAEVLKHGRGHDMDNYSAIAVFVR